MVRETLDNKTGQWLKPEEVIDTLKKRKETDGLSFDEISRLKELETSLTEREKREKELAEKKRGIIHADPIEAQRLKQRADALRKEEKEKYIGGQYL